MLSLFFEAHQHRSNHGFDGRRGSMDRGSIGEMSGVRSMHAAHYDKLTSQAEHTLKLLLGIQADKDEDDMDPAERQRYRSLILDFFLNIESCSCPHLMHLIRIPAHYSERVKTHFLNFLK